MEVRVARRFSFVNEHMESLNLFAASLVSWALGAALMVPALLLPGDAQMAPNRSQDPSVQSATDRDGW